MIRAYCKGNNHNMPLCEECRDLLDYSLARLDACKFAEAKTFCSQCDVNCYKDDMRVRIKKVMRYSGPRMLYKDPLLALRHLLKL